MKIEVETLSPVEKKVTVEIDPERVGQELDRAYAALGRRVKLRGFRPGKAPRTVLERNFRDEVERDVVQALVQGAFSEAIRQHGMAAVAPPRVDLEQDGLAATQPFRFTARVEVKPKLEPKDYRGLEVKRRPVEVTDQTVQDELVRIQEGMAQLVPVEGRDQAQQGDFAVIDHEGTVEGRPFEGAVAQAVTVKVQPGDLAEGNMPQLEGKKVGDAFDMEQEFPPDYRMEPLRGKRGTFKITLKALRTRQVPALDDELAKDLSLPNVETLDALKARIRDDLTKREQRRSDAELKDALVKAALAKNDFEVPPALVERSIDLMMEGAAQRFARQGLDIREMGLDFAKLRADVRDQALLEVRGALILEAIADAEKIEVSADDVQNELARMAAEARVPLAEFQAQVRQDPHARGSVLNRVREEKALAFLTSEAKLT
ncbi:MAG TPA: trigger factor [Anaeromyxobacteraceae bacterium]|nr:trigger factor [Anaeromyxobacteraceae bacterium]